MNLLPTPKRMTTNLGFLTKKALKPAHPLHDSRLQKALESLPLSEEGVDFEIQMKAGMSEAYTLSVQPDRITICAESDAGAFYALQTLKQLFSHELVPCCYIEDEPDFSYRGFYQDVTRGKVPTVETLKKLIDQMAYYKMNSFQLYIEHTFAFREFSDSIEKTGYLSPEEIKELDNYCYENFIEFIPSVATFGHLYELLQKEQYQELCELEHYEPKHVFWHERMVHHTIDPTNPKSFELIQSLIDQYLPLFRSNKFNICGDETFDLQCGRHKGQNVGRLYVDFIKKTIEYLHSKGKTVMMWGDILVSHPEVIDELPDGVEFLNWNYEPFPKEEQLEIFEKQTLTQIVCPAVATYAWIAENVGKEVKNIDWITELGKKHGAKGVLNTNWGDYGNPCSLEVSMYGFVYGAEKSWNVLQKADGIFDEKINHLLYGSPHGAAAIKELSQFVTDIDWRDFVKMYSDMIYPEQLHPHIPTVDEIERIQCAYLDFKKKYENETWEKDQYRQEMLIQAEGIAVIAELMGAAQGYPVRRFTDTREWLEKFRYSWLLRNKESELGEIVKMFCYIEEYVRKQYKGASL